MNSTERKNQLVERIESAGAVAVALGFTGTIVSGIAFIASESSLSLQAIERLSTQVNGFYQVAMTSLVVGGIGAAVTLTVDRIKK